MKALRVFGKWWLSLIGLSTIAIFSTLMNAYAQSDSIVRAYIQRWAPLAMQEMRRTGIPASIKLAQAILESAAGTSWLARTANNHFGIKCHGWPGPGVYKDDDKPNECFRKYPSADSSFRDHSHFLRTRKRYAFLFNYSPLDYKKWAYGLKQAGYATNPHYPQKLITIIERYNLARWDTLALMGHDTLFVRHQHKPPEQQDKPGSKLTHPQPEQCWQDTSINAVRAIVLHCPVPLREIAERKRIPLSRLQKWNDHLPEATLWQIGIVYLQPKRKRSLTHQFYVTRGGETPAEVAQRFGIRLNALAHLNGWTTLPKRLHATDTVCLRPACARRRLSLNTPTTPRQPPEYAPLEPDWAYLSRVPCQFIEHRVHTGETLTGIAQHYRIPLKWLYSVNPALSEVQPQQPLTPGIVVVIPLPLTDTSPEAEPELPF